MHSESDELFTKISNIEDFICNCKISILGYALVNKNKLSNLLQSMYNALPQILIDYKEFLDRQKPQNVSSTLKCLIFELENSKNFFGFLFLKKENYIDILNKMYAALPDEMKLCYEQRRRSI